ncbi:MAG: hypothetical protein M5T61_14810 [Acidimicrobiia bacterium]|nr:hypothetical protein [Acidimicrobiia bacterium]
MPVPLDEYPVHQVPLSMRHMDTSDRNAYDRCYFNAHERTGEIFLVTGLGVYPNLGVIDAYATVRRGDVQSTVRMSDALGDDRMSQSVGPYRIEVLDPLNRLRLVCDADDHGIGFDLTWTGSFPAAEEVPHVMRRNGRIALDAQRFWQVGTWSGALRVGGEEIVVGDERWVGSRDRSWGIRSVGEAEPPGRAEAEPQEGAGFWWTYVPLRFDDFSLMVIAQEDGDGTRTHCEAVRVWPSSSGRVPDVLGWPEIEVEYRSGTRIPRSAVVSIPQRRSSPLVVEVDCLSHVALNCGSGYSRDPDWGHGQWKGRGWIEGVEHDMSDPELVGRSQFGVIDHVARARCGGAEGWGLFEHGCFGRHEPSGFADWSSTAP